MRVCGRYALTVRKQYSVSCWSDVILSNKHDNALVINPMLFASDSQQSPLMAAIISS